MGQYIGTIIHRSRELHKILSLHFFQSDNYFYTTSNFAILKAALTALAFLGGYKAVSWTFFVLTSPLRRLRGPPSTSLITGHALLVRDLYPAAINGEWTRDYGKVIRLKTLFGVRLHFSIVYMFQI